MLWPCKSELLLYAVEGVKCNQPKFNSRMILTLTSKYKSAASKQVIENVEAKTMTGSASVAIRAVAMLGQGMATALVGGT